MTDEEFNRERRRLIEKYDQIKRDYPHYSVYKDYPDDMKKRLKNWHVEAEVLLHNRLRENNGDL